VLAAVASDNAWRNAPQLRRVSLRDDVVELEVDQRWAELPRLIDRVSQVKGVASVVVNGEPSTVTRPTQHPSSHLT
jgi:hypothetical protein